MKTSVEIDDQKVALAKRLGKVETLRQLVDEALDAYIQKARRSAMAELLGSDFFDSRLTTDQVRGRGRTRR